MSKQKKEERFAVDTKLIELFTSNELTLDTQCNTRLDAESKSITTKLTLDFSKSTLKDLLNWSRQNRVIAWQSARRQSDSIPTSATMVCTRSRQTLSKVEKAEKFVNSMTDIEKAELIEKLQA